MQYTQIFDPLGHIGISALVAFLPIVCFLLCLLIIKLKVYISAFITVLFAGILAFAVYGMPLNLIGASFSQGFVNGIWPIAWIIVAAIFLYKIADKSGSMEIIKTSIMQITPDPRVQVILIGFCFGSFLEGAIGFGGPVAITAMLLVGLGLKPVQAAGLCLVANTAPVAFGAVGIPIIAMTNMLGIEQYSISAMTGRLLFPFSFCIPFVVVFLMDGFKGVKETFAPVFVAALSFVVTQFLSSNYLGAELPDILSAVVSIACTAAFLKFTGWKASGEYKLEGSESKEVKAAQSSESIPFGKVVKAWSPFILLIALVILWTFPQVKAAIGSWSSFTIPFESIFGGQVIHPDTGKVVGMNLGISLIVNQAGSAILIAALISIVILGTSGEKVVASAKETIKEMFFPCVTIGLLVSFAMISKNSGMGNTLGMAFAQTTGNLYAFFSPVVGWLGVFLTGSDTSSNLLFGTLQQAAALELDSKLQALFIAANSVGGVVGKMISPQSIAVACGAVGLVGRESELLKYTLKKSIILVILIGIWTLIIANLIQGLIPDIVSLQR